MRKQIVSLTAGLMISLMSNTSWAADKASVEMGKNLFSDPALAGAGSSKTCSTCHADGKGLEMAGRKENLAEMINRCIVGALQGKALDDGPKLESLLLYIKSLGKK